MKKIGHHPRARITALSMIAMALLFGGAPAGSMILRREPLMLDDLMPRTVRKMVEPAPTEPEKPAETKRTPPEPPPTERRPRALPTMVISDMELADTVDVAMLLRLMARLAGVNMLVSPRVEGAVEFSFHGVPWDEAFHSIIASAGLAYDWRGDVLRVMSVADIRRELELDMALRDRESVREDLRRVEPMEMRVVPLRYLVAAGIESTLTRMLDADSDFSGHGGPRRRSIVVADNESNSIIVHATREDMNKATNLIDQLDRPRPQVRIEVRVVEATRDMARQLGMQWGGQVSRLDQGRVYRAGAAGAGAAGFVSDFPAIGLAPGEGFTLGLLTERIGMGELLNLQLTALQQQGKVRIQSSPVVTTLDNETATIESGEERAYRTTSGTGNERDVQVEWKEAKLSLEVTPHVVDGRKLRVRIIAAKDSFDESKPQTGGEFPVSTKRAQTTVLLADGETTMIGGLSLESDGSSMRGVPFLMRIPLLGNLFRNRSRTRRFDETIIFITPTIL